MDTLSQPARPPISYLAHSEPLGRPIRQDPLPQLGVATQTLVERALDAAEVEQASELLTYMHEEFRRLYDIMFVWVADLLGQIAERGGATDSASPLPSLATATFRRFPVGEGPLTRARAALRAGRCPEARPLVDQVRQEFVIVHDISVAWVQDLLTHLAERWGEDAVAASVEGTFERIWGPRYARWHEMTPLQQLHLSVEGMRGHLSGTARRGDVVVEEEPDRYVMRFEPCGSGGVLRLGDPASGRAPYSTTGVTQAPHPWAWNKTGVHWYCTHCPLVMESLWTRQTGYPMRPVDFEPGAAATTWYVYKRPELTRPVHFERMGMAPPAALAR